MQLPYNVQMHFTIKSHSGKLDTITNTTNASVNSSCAQHPPPPTPGLFPSFLHARGFLSENNYTEDFTGKESRLAHLSRTGKIEEVCKGMFLILCMHFIAYRARIMYRSNRSFNMPPPPGIPRAFDTFAVPGRREFDYQSSRGWGI